jgi:hypothetical protein
MADDVITELEELGAEKVSGVGSPANGTPWLLLKGTDTAMTTETPQTTSAEADAMEDEVTKGEAEEIEAMLTKARFAGFCGTDDCGVCKERFGPLYEQILEKAKLDAADRRALPKSAFAIPSKAPGSGSYPIHDESHARAALSRASGKPEEGTVRAKVHAKYPNMGTKSTGVPAESVKVPKEHGHMDTGQSKDGGPMTGKRIDRSDPAFTEGGESSYEIPVESKVKDNPESPKRMDRPGEGVTVVPARKDSWTIEVIEKQNWISLDNGDDDEAEKGEAPAAAATTPGDSAWQAYDAASCGSVARGLAEAKIVLDQIRTREMTEAVSGNPSEWFDSYQLSCAMDDICSALGLVASLAYREAASGNEMSSAPATKSLAAQQSQIGQIMAALRTTNPANPGDRTSEEESTMATITKEELDAQIAETAAKATKDALKAFRKAEAKKAKARKAKDKKKKGKNPFADMGDAEKNANNGGDITEQTMNGQVHGKHDASDVGSVGHGVNSQYRNKSKKGKAAKAQAEKLDQALALIQKMAATPRSGGPVLDGQARGAGFSPASESRLGDVTKGAVDEIAMLEEKLAKSTDTMEIDQVSRELTLARLRKGHETGQI